MRRLLPCLVVLALPALALGSPPPRDARFGLHGQLELSTGYAQRENVRFSGQPDGSVLLRPRRERSGVRGLRADLTATVEQDLGDRAFLDVTNALFASLADPTRVDSAQYDLIDNDLRLDAGVDLGRGWAAGAGLSHLLYREAFDPIFDAETLAGDVTLDLASTARESWGLLVRHGETSFRGNPTADFSSTRLRLSYFSFTPDHLGLDVLPTPLPLDRDTSAGGGSRNSPLERAARQVSPAGLVKGILRPEGEASDGTFDYSQHTDLPASRPLVDDLGADRIARTIRSPRVISTHDRQFRDRIDLRQSGIGVALEYEERDVDVEETADFREAGLVLHGQWSLDDKKHIVLRDRLSYHDQEGLDTSRFLFDRVQNLASLELYRITSSTESRMGGSVESFHNEDFTQFDRHLASFSTTTTYRFGGRYTLTSDNTVFRDFHDNSRLDYPARRVVLSDNAFGVRFGEQSSLTLWVGYERQSVFDVQTEFDSSFRRWTYGLTYSHDLGGSAWLDAGYRLQDEEHSDFPANDRRENLVFSRVVARL